MLSRVTRPFTWFLGALSLLTLFDDLDVVVLRSQALGWIDTYANRVESVGNWLFGWIDFDRIAWTETSSHVLTFLLLVVVPVSDAAVDSGLQRLRSDSHDIRAVVRAGQFGAYLASVILSILTALFLGIALDDWPSAWSLAIAAVLGYLLVRGTVAEVARELSRSSWSGPFTQRVASRFIFISAVVVALLILDRILGQN